MPDPRSTPSPATLRLVEEAPYLALVRSQGQAETDAALAGEPELGHVHAAAAKPSGDALSASVAVDAGTGYAEAGALSFAPAGALLRSLPGRADAAEAFVTRGLSIRRAQAGDLAAVGGELVRIDAVEPVTDPALGPCQRIVIGRGCLDTPPRDHPAGTALIVREDDAELGGDAFLAGEAVSVIGGLLATLAGSAWARAALRYGVIALAILLFLLALRRSGERVGRLAERLATMERTHDAQRRMLEAAARRPRSRDDLAERLRGGRF